MSECCHNLHSSKSNPLHVAQPMCVINEPHFEHGVPHEREAFSGDPIPNSDDTPSFPVQNYLVIDDVVEDPNYYGKNSDKVFYWKSATLSICPDGPLTVNAAKDIWYELLIVRYEDGQLQWNNFNGNREERISGWIDGPGNRGRSLTSWPGQMSYFEPNLTRFQLNLEEIFGSQVVLRPGDNIVLRLQGDGAEYSEIDKISLTVNGVVRNGQKHCDFDKAPVKRFRTIS